MGNPTDEQVTAAIQALQQDATQWNVMSLRLTNASGTARGLTLSAFEFSGLGHAAGIDETYEQLRARMTDLLNQASSTFDEVSDAVRKAADDYERDEENTVHRMKNVY